MELSYPFLSLNPRPAPGCDPGSHCRSLCLMLSSVKWVSHM